MKIRINRYKEPNRFILLLIVLGWILTFITILSVLGNHNDYKYLVFLPASYSVSRTIIRKAYYQLSPGLLTYELVTFLRFTALPLSIITADALSTFASNYNYLHLAVVLMIYELLCCSLILVLYHPQKSRMIVSEYHVGNRKLVFALAVAVIILLYFDNRSLTGNMDVLHGVLDTDIEAQLNETSGVVGIIWQALWTYLFAYVIWSIYVKTESNNKAVSATLSSVVCIIYYFVIFTGQVTISRWYVIISAIASVVWLLYLYPSNKRNILITVGLPFSILLLTVTLIKNVGIEALGYSRPQQIESIMTPTFMDSYFAGPVNVNNAIGLKENTAIGFHSFWFDIVNNMPYVNSLIDRSQSSAALYNSYIGRGDQIIPLLGQSFVWCGYLLTPLLSMISVALFMKSDTAFHESTGIDKYVYSFLAAWCGTETILNMTIWLSWMYSRVIPMFLLFAFARFMIARRQQ